MELLLAFVREVSRVAALANPNSVAYAAILKNHENAARSVGKTLLVIAARTPTDIDDAFTRITRENVRAVTVMFDAFFFSQQRHIAASALRHRIAVMGFFSEFAEAGCSMSYGQNLADHYRQTATYVDKILEGAKPGDLPIQQSTKLEFVINLKTVKALGLTIPQSLLLRADRVIE